MLFDRYFVVDWSASSRPNTGADSIWIGAASREGVPTWDTINPPTRADAFKALRDTLTVDIMRGRRVLVGFDFPLGYPATFAEVVCPSWKNPWLGVWKSLQRAVQDSPKNVNNRFEVAGEFNRLIGLASGPFWGHPNGVEIPNLSWQSGDRSVGLPQYRHTEARVSGVQEVWKM